MLVIISPIEKEGAYYSAPITWSVDQVLSAQYLLIVTKLDMYTVVVP